MKKIKLMAQVFIYFSIHFLFLENTAIAENETTQKAVISEKKNKMELKTLKIQGNKELPKGLFIVPWQDIKKKKGKEIRQRLVLHSLYGDLFDPVNPSEYFIGKE